MNRNLLLRVTAPAVAVGLALLIAALTGVWYINRIQGPIAELLRDDVASLEAAQTLELAARRVKLANIVYLMDPKPSRLVPIKNNEAMFDRAIEMARHSISTEEEANYVTAVTDEYSKIRSEFEHLRGEDTFDKSAAHIVSLIEQFPIRRVADPCQELVRIAKDRMARTADDAHRAAAQGYLAMIILGIVGPLSGLVMGYGVARGLRQSIYRLNVQVQDMAHHLGHDVASMNVLADGDFQSLDRRMQQVVREVEDVTVRLQQQQRDLLRAEQLAAVGQLAAGVAHEVRNPLTGIKMLVEATHRKDNPRPLDAEDLRVIERELGRVERTVQGLLDFARLPAPNAVVCDLKEVIVPAYDLIRARAERQGVAVRLHAPGVPALVSIDRDQIHTVLLNLMMNALDAMPTGGQLDLSWSPPKNNAIQLTVADTGDGIPEELLDKIFAPFATTKPTGTGLGLSLVARIVEEHRGTIAATTRTRGGASFVMTLPETQLAAG
jgi:two-component system, NtrC family, sensor histidine kinase HydH